MKMRSPVVAMLWENWRLTRVEVVQRLGLGIVAASAALVVFDASAIVAASVLFWINCMFWLSIAKLNGGRFLDGYRPGFSLHLLYTRPVRTAEIVGVAMAYDAVSCAALYLVSAAFVGFIFDKPLPLLTVALPLMTFHVVCAAVQWTTRSRVVQWVGAYAIWMPTMFINLRDWVPLQFEFSIAGYALMASIGLVSFGLTVAGVARQRRGDAVAIVPRAARSFGYPDWLVTLFRFPCPTSSATSAQLWFDLRSSGLPVFAIGLALALLIALLFAISIPVEWLRPFAVLCAMLSGPIVLILGGNAFGIRWRQGRAYVSTFEATLPCSVAQLARLKVLLRTTCVLAALIVIGVSVWKSTSLVSEWGVWVVDGKAAGVGLVQTRRTIGDAFGGLTGYAHVAQAIVASVFVALTIALRAAFTALRARYPRRMIASGSLLLLYILALILLAWSAQRGIASESLLHAIFRATRWIAAAAIALGTAYVAWRTLAERLLTPHQISGVVLLWVTFGVALLVLLRAVGVPTDHLLTTQDVGMLWPAWLPLIASIVAPWALSRIRHT